MLSLKALRGRGTDLSWPLPGSDGSSHPLACGRITPVSASVHSFLLFFNSDLPSPLLLHELLSLDLGPSQVIQSDLISESFT